METILKISNLKKTFVSNLILNNVNFEINKGEIIGLIGMSGAGKTTFLNTIIGFIKPDIGEVLFYDNLKKDFISVYENQDKIKLKFGFASQLPSFYSKLSVYENLEYFGSLYGLSKEAIKQNINILLKMVELEKSKNILAENLSGGMQRRLDIACSLIHNPDLLILDEPTSDLDPIISKQIWNLLHKINKLGTTLIVASHNFSDLEFFCSRIAILSKGEIKIGSLFELTSQFSKGQEIHLETYPGKYDKILENLDDSNIIKKQNKGNEIIIFTTKPDTIIKKIFPLLSKLDENIIDLKIERLNLEDIFSKLNK
ncbi:MAG: ABC transporter ATP-binding protein [Candidatus Woesearchaeota archaeon]